MKLLQDNFGSICTYENTAKLIVKKCTCAVGLNTCPLHSSTDRSSGDGYFMNFPDQLSEVSLSSTVENSFTTESTITVVPKPSLVPLPAPPDELKLSLASLVSDKLNSEQRKDNDSAFQRWLAEKNRQRKEVIAKQQRIQQLILEEKEKKLKTERENFMTWLNRKRMQEKNNQKQKYEQQKVLEMKRQEEKHTRRKLAETQFQLWLKQKEEERLIQGVNTRIKQFQEAEQKQQRLRRSAAAYEKWLIESRNKPRPIPLNKGLESLRASVSVSFVNPIPWVSNIPQSKKPITK